MLLSLALGEIVPEAEKPLIALATRVGRNREIAGLHYPIDTTTGFRIAREAHPLLQTCNSYKDSVVEAKKEWDALR